MFHIYCNITNNWFEQVNLYTDLLVTYDIIIFLILVIDKITVLNISLYILEISLLYLTIAYLVFLRVYKDRIYESDKDKMKKNIAITGILYLLSIFAFQEFIIIKVIIFMWFLLLSLVTTSSQLVNEIKNLLNILISLVILISILFLSQDNVQVVTEKNQKERIYVNNNLNEISQYDENECFIFLNDKAVKYGAEIIIYVVLEENGEKYICEKDRIFDYTVKKANERQYLEKVTESYLTINNNSKIERQTKAQRVEYILYY